MKENRTREDSGDLSELPPKKWGRRVLLGDDLDLKVQLYLKKVREGGGVVSAWIAMAAARGIVLTCDRSMLVEFGGHVELNWHWAYSLLHRMNFVKRKATTAKSKYAITDSDCVKGEFLEDVVATVEIPSELVLNWIRQVSESSQVAIRPWPAGCKEGGGWWCTWQAAPCFVDRWLVTSCPSRWSTRAKQHGAIPNSSFHQSGISPTHESTGPTKPPWSNT